MGYRPLSELPREERRRVTGRTFDLPKAKHASVPFYYDGNGGAPVSGGTKISIWHLEPTNPFNGSFWFPRTANDLAWLEPCVFRIREYTPPSNMKQDSASMELVAHIARLATAMERIADALARRP